MEPCRSTVVNKPARSRTASKSSITFLRVGAVHRTIEQFQTTGFADVAAQRRAAGQTRDRPQGTWFVCFGGHHLPAADGLVRRNRPQALEVLVGLALDAVESVVGEAVDGDLREIAPKFVKHDAAQFFSLTASASRSGS